MTRASRGTGPLKDTPLASSPLQTKTTTQGQSVTQNTSATGSPQKNLSLMGAKAKVEPAQGQLSQKKAGPAPGNKTPQENIKESPKKQLGQPSATAKEDAAPQQDTGGFFGLGGTKKQTDAAKPTESVTGKMFGFGSSIFSSASTLISSEAKTTPPGSPKMPAMKDSKSSTAKKPELDGKQGQQQAKSLSSVEPLKKATAFQVASKVGQSSCPLCKVELTVGSKDPPNYNTCTQCKNNVCNQCGFNPMPNIQEVRYFHHTPYINHMKKVNIFLFYLKKKY